MLGRGATEADRQTAARAAAAPAASTGPQQTRTSSAVIAVRVERSLMADRWLMEWHRLSLQLSPVRTAHLSTCGARRSRAGAVRPAGSFTVLPSHGVKV